jgi:hypothetical protein
LKNESEKNESENKNDFKIREIKTKRKLCANKKAGLPLPNINQSK